MSTARNRLSQVEFTKIVFWLQNYSGEKTTLPSLFNQARNELEFVITQSAIERAIDEFGLREKLIAPRKAKVIKSKLSERVVSMEDRVFETEIAFLELRERLEAIETVIGMVNKGVAQ